MVRERRTGCNVTCFTPCVGDLARERDPLPSFCQGSTSPVGGRYGSGDGRRRETGRRGRSVRSEGPRQGSASALADTRGGLGALVLVEHHLADPNHQRRDLHALVLATELQALLQRQLARRDQLLEVVGGGGADVGLLLLLGDVDVHVLGARVLADDHAFVDLGGRLDEHHAALLQVRHRVRRRGTRAIGHQRAVVARADLACPGLVALGDVVSDARPAGVGEELGTEADQPAGRHQELHPHPAGAVVGHLLHAALARGQQLGDRAEVLLGGVDGEPLDGLVHLAVDLTGDDLRLADGELEALATHLLDEDGQGELAAALHLPGVRSLRGQDAQRHVADQLAVEPVLDQAGGDLRALLAPDERRGVGADGHGDGRLVDVDQRERDGVLGVGERLADGDLGDAGDGTDVSGTGLLAGLALEALGDQQLGDLDRLDRAVALDPGHVLALLQVALVDPHEGEPAEERRGVEVGDVGLQRCPLVVLRRGDGVEDGAEERLEVGGVGEAAVLGLLDRGASGLGRGVDDGEVEGVLAVVLVEQVQEELVGLVDDLGDAGVGAVDLVHDEDDGQVGVERLAEHEARLRQRALAGVDEQHDPVDHRQSALHLTAEVGVAGSVDDVDRHALRGARTGVVDRGVLREDRDPLLALEVARVHDALGDTRLLLVRGEGAGLVEHRVDQRGLAVVDVRDDRDVPEVRTGGRHGGTTSLSQAGIDP